MTPDAVKDHVKQVLAGIAPEADLDAVDPAANIREELDIDSMDFLRLMQGLSARLHVDVPEAEYPKLATLSGLVDWFSRRA